MYASKVLYFFNPKKQHDLSGWANIIEKIFFTAEIVVYGAIIAAVQKCFEWS